MKYLTRSFLLILLASTPVLPADDPITWNLWPGEAAGEIVTLPPESDRTTDDSRLAAGVRSLGRTLTIHRHIVKDLVDAD